MVLEIYGVTPFAQTPVFCAPFTGMYSHSDGPAVGSVYSTELHNIAQEKRHAYAPGWRGNRRFVGHLVPLLFLCCCRGVQGLSVWFTVMADCFLPLAAQAHPRTDGKVNVYKTVEEVCWQENSTKCCDWVKGCSRFQWDVLKCSSGLRTQCLCLTSLCDVCEFLSQYRWAFLEALGYCAIVRGFIEGIRMPDITVSLRGSPANSLECRFGKVNENAVCMGWHHKDPTLCS